MDIACVAAIARNGALGYQGKLPWQLKGEMALFKKITLGHAVIMGRKTYDSLPRRPLPNRLNIVISSQKVLSRQEEDKNTLIVNNLDDAFHQAAQWDSQQDTPKKVTMVIGGGEIYRLAIEHTTIFYRTLVDLSPQADVFFHGFKEREWQKVDTLAHYQADNYSAGYQTEKWIRKV